MDLYNKKKNTLMLKNADNIKGASHLLARWGEGKKSTLHFFFFEVPKKKGAMDEGVLRWDAVSGYFQRLIVARA